MHTSMMTQLGLLSAILFLCVGCGAFPLILQQHLLKLPPQPMRRVQLTNLWQTFPVVGSERSQSSLFSSDSWNAETSPSNELAVHLDADRHAFAEFCKKTLCGEQRRLSMDKFVAHPEVSSLLANGDIEMEGVRFLWQSLLTEGEELAEDDAYELLHMVRDLPDPEEAAFVQESFSSLTNSDGLVSFDSFRNWSDVKEILGAGVMTADELTELWERTAGSKDDGIAMDKFRQLSRALDERIDVHA